MSPTVSAVTRVQKILIFLLFLLLLAVALAPWCHNRAYVRHFYDYGVVMGATGRMEQGQRPYVDFVTPIQTGWYAMNWAAEKIAGGTFQAMTWAGAASILVAMTVLGAMLARRWPWWAALIAAGALTCATVSQHTLLWYNPWGVVWLAVAAWSGAVAPVLRRAQLGWHGLMALALFLGGINKINMQLMALGIAAGWAVRAALMGESSWPRVLATWGFQLGCGVVLPVLAEMGWTGASFALWWHNVIAQMAGGRTGMIFAALEWRFLLVPGHDYYGALRLPQVGLAMVALIAMTVAAIWYHRRAWRDRLLASGCAIIMLLAGLILFSTNMDIAYIALGGCYALLIALWIGFGLPACGPWFWSVMMMPAVIIGAVSWDAAWRGQRSQFGYSQAARSDYVSGDQAGPAFGYLKGTYVPPEVFVGFKAVSDWRTSLAADRQRAVLYGPGAEWAAHIWPAERTPDLPLYILGGWQFGPKEYAATYAAINSGRFKEIMVSYVQDNWMEELKRVLDLRYVRRSLGEIYHRYSRAEQDILSDWPVDFSQKFGGSADSRSLSSPGVIFESHESAGRLFIGTANGLETMKLAGPSNRVRGEVIVSRLDKTDRRKMYADYMIYAEAESGVRFPRWQQRVELPADKDEVVAEYAIDSSGHGVRFFVEVPAEFSGEIAAGWRGPIVAHSNAQQHGNPRWLYPADQPITMLTAAEIAAFLPADRGLTPHTVMVRGGRMTAEGLELVTGGEVWIRVDGTVVDFSGQFTLMEGAATATPPMVRGMWQKGIRLEAFSREKATAAQRTGTFRSWTPEANGWLIVAVDPVNGHGAIRLRVERFAGHE